MQARLLFLVAAISSAAGWLLMDNSGSIHVGATLLQELDYGRAVASVTSGCSAPAPRIDAAMSGNLAAHGLRMASGRVDLESVGCPFNIGDTVRVSNTQASFTLVVIRRSCWPFVSDAVQLHAVEEMVVIMIICWCFAALMGSFLAIEDWRPPPCIRALVSRVVQRRRLPTRLWLMCAVVLRVATICFAHPAQVLLRRWRAILSHAAATAAMAFRARRRRQLACAAERQISHTISVAAACASCLPRPDHGLLRLWQRRRAALERAQAFAAAAVYAHQRRQAERRQRQLACQAERRRRTDHGLMVSAVLPRPKLRWLLLLLFILISPPSPPPPPAEPATIFTSPAVALSKAAYEAPRLTPIEDAHGWLVQVGPAGLERMLRPTTTVVVTFPLSNTHMHVSDVPTDLSVAQVSAALAELLGVNGTQMALLSGNSTSINPSRQLASLVAHGNVSFQVIPRDRVGGDCAPDAEEPPITEPAAATSYPRNQRRRRLDPQPEPREKMSNRPNQRWISNVRLEEEGSGKAEGTWRERKAPADFTGPTKEDVIRQQEEYIISWLHPRPRGCNSGKRFEPTEPVRESKRRATTPVNMAEPKGTRGPSSEQARAGPGRGHWAEAAGSSNEPVLARRVDEPETVGSNWLAHASAAKVCKGCACEAACARDAHARVRVQGCECKGVCVRGCACEGACARVRV
jgi:hypothetical protein